MNKKELKIQYFTYHIHKRENYLYSYALIILGLIAILAAIVFPLMQIVPQAQLLFYVTFILVFAFLIILYFFRHIRITKEIRDFNNKIEEEYKILKK